MQQQGLGFAFGCSVRGRGLCCRTSSLRPGPSMPWRRGRPSSARRDDERQKSLGFAKFESSTYSRVCVCYQPHLSIRRALASPYASVNEKLYSYFQHCFSKYQLYYYFIGAEPILNLLIGCIGALQDQNTLESKQSGSAAFEEKKLKIC